MNTTRWRNPIRSYAYRREFYRFDAHAERLLQAFFTSELAQWSARFPVLAQSTVSMTIGPMTYPPRGYVFPADIAVLHHPMGHPDFRPSIYMEFPLFLPSARCLTLQRPDRPAFIHGDSVSEAMTWIFFHEVAHIVSLDRYFRRWPYASVAEPHRAKIETIADTLVHRLFPAGVRDATIRRLRFQFQQYRHPRWLRWLS